MKNPTLVLVAYLLLAVACGGEAADPTEPPAAVRVDAWAEPVIVGEAPDWADPFIDVAVGADDLPIVVFNDVVGRAVEFRRCVDTGCAESPVEARIPIPDDLGVLDVAVEVSPSGVPVVLIDGWPLAGADDPAPPRLTYLVSCGDADCGSQESARFPKEWNADLAFAPDGTLVMASVTDPLMPEEYELGPPEEAAPQDLLLSIRTCSDLACRREVSKVDIPIYPAHQVPSLAIDDGSPRVALGQGTGSRPEDGGGFIVLIDCDDPACASHETIEAAIETESAFDLAVSGKTVVYATENGLQALAWEHGFEDPATLALLDELAGNEEMIVGGAAARVTGGPVVAYLHMRDIETEAEHRQILVAECDGAGCSTGAVCAAFSQAADAYLNTVPAVATDAGGDPIIAFHTCEPGCQPMYVHLLRCEGGCATAFPDRVLETWGTS